MTKRRFEKIVVICCIVLGTVSYFAGKAYSAPVSPTVPVQLQFLGPARTFSWNQIMSYRIRLVSTANFVSEANVSLIAYEQVAANSNGKGGSPPVYLRRYTLAAMQSKSFDFRIMTFPGPPVGAYANWCLEATVMVKGAAPQTARTCAIAADTK